MNVKAKISALSVGALAVAGVSIATVAGATEPDPGLTINVNASCGSQMHLDITYDSAPQSPWTFKVYSGETLIASLVDADQDLMGFHPVIPASDLPEGSYSYSVDAFNGNHFFSDVYSGEVDCGDTEPETSASPSASPSGSSSPEPTVTSTPENTVTATPEPSTDPTSSPEPTVSPEASPSPAVSPSTAPSGGPTFIPDDPEAPVESTDEPTKDTTPEAKPAVPAPASSDDISFTG